MGDNLKKNMVGALTWNTINIGGIQVVQLIIGIILARILAPEDFGLIGVLFIFIGLSTILIDGGFGQGLIRKKEAEDKDFSTIFYLNLVVSIILYLILFFLAPFIADFFNNKDLIVLSRVLFISVLLFPLYFIQQVKIMKSLDYKSMAIVNILSVLISGVIAVVLAFLNFGPWALVWQQVFFHFTKALLYQIFIHWKPIKYFSIDIVKDMWKFSAPIMTQFTLNVIFNNLYMVLIGRFYPLKQTGYFAQANKYSETVNAATQNILNYTVFPIFSKIQDEKERALRIYRKLVTTVSLITFPLVGFLFIAAEPVIITLIGEKWLNSVIMFQLLILANLFTPMFTINVGILNANGESSNTLKLEIIKKILISISIVCVFSLGINMMLAGYIIASFLSFFISMYYIKKSFRHFYRHQIRDLSGILLIVTVVSALCFPIQMMDLHFLIKLTFTAILYISLYIIALRLFLRIVFFEMLDEIKLKFKIAKKPV